MKIQFLLMFSISLFCACEIQQKAQTNEVSNQANSNLETVSNKSANLQTITNKQPDQIVPKPVDDSRFKAIKIERTDKNKKFDLNIDVKYPQLKSPKTQPEIKFNQYVKKQVDEQVLDFKKYLIDAHKTRKHKGEYEINLEYTIHYYSKNFTSILMYWNGYSGYLNMDYFPSTINFDLKSGKIAELKDLFEPKTKYLNKVAEESRKILERTCLSCGCGNGISAGDPLPENLIEEAKSRNQTATNANSRVDYNHPTFFEDGTKPTEGNYSGWSITAEGLKITFGEYQIGPGCIGIIDITIPFKDLQPILKQNFLREFD